jgi:putative tryptophan/tyrosine transport system substrate-binding protein
MAMRRRQFIAALGGAAAWPLAARGQHPMPVIGYFAVSTQSTDKPRTDALVQRLRELGWIEGRTVAIEYRWADGRTDRFAEIAAELARLKVDVIITAGAGPVSAVKQATSLIPIVFAIASDPVGTGLVASLARPGGNVTGLSYLGPDLAAKRLELAREVFSGLPRLAIMANSGAAGAVVEMRETQTAASKLGLEVVAFEIQREDQIAPAFVALKDRADALYVVADPLVNANRIRIVTFALAARLPTIFGERENVDAGGLMSYGPNVPDMYRRAAQQIDKILRGAKPSDIPVEQPTRFEFVINLKTAKALGLAIPPTLLARADEVVE